MGENVLDKNQRLSLSRILIIFFILINFAVQVRADEQSDECNRMVDRLLDEDIYAAKWFRFPNIGWDPSRVNNTSNSKLFSKETVKEITKFSRFIWKNINVNNSEEYNILSPYIAIRINFVNDVKQLNYPIKYYIPFHYINELNEKKQEDYIAEFIKNQKYFISYPLQEKKDNDIRDVVYIQLIIQNIESEEEAISITKLAYFEALTNFRTFSDNVLKSEIILGLNADCGDSSPPDCRYIKLAKSIYQIKKSEFPLKREAMKNRICK